MEQTGTVSNVLESLAMLVPLSVEAATVVKCQFLPVQLAPIGMVLDVFISQISARPV